MPENTIETEAVKRILLVLFDEGYAGSQGKGTWYIDNEPGCGLLGTIARLDVPVASRPLSPEDPLTAASHGRPEGGTTRRSYRRVYPDLPFMGSSSDPDSVRNSDDMLEVVACFVRRVLPDGPFLLAGESYGGYLARGLVRLMPERISGLLFVCPAVTARSEDRDAPAHGAARAEDGYADGWDPSDVEEFESVAVVRDRYCLERFSREILPGLEAARGDRLEALKEAG